MKIQTDLINEYSFIIIISFRINVNTNPDDMKIINSMFLKSKRSGSSVECSLRKPLNTMADGASYKFWLGLLDTLRTNKYQELLELNSDMNNFEM